ncbi:MAG TPA: LLM class flavin-dependent oxidoreductase, partial [Thermomicrobiaceae bacterium]|nr:LLM class flavin-dependent oxidoreductase [Thermomicrobiaceae bacterium]
MKFCLDLSHHRWARSDDPKSAADDTLRIARIADQAAIDSLWLSEDPDGWDAFSVLSAVATQTERLRLGTGVTNPYLRHPNLIAMSLATLDRLSGGRAFLGLGRGQPEWYQHALGMRIGSPLAALDETIDLLHQWWRPEHAASISGHFEIRDWHRSVSPVQSTIPIYLAALGPKALALAIRRADGLLIADFASLTYLRQTIPRLREQLERQGRDPDAFDIYLRANLRVTDDPE